MMKRLLVYCVILSSFFSLYQLKAGRALVTEEEKEEIKKFEALEHKLPAPPSVKDKFRLEWHGHIALEAFFDTRQLGDGRRISPITRPLETVEGFTPVRGATILPTTVSSKKTPIRELEPFPGEEVAGQVVLFPPPKLLDKNCSDILDKGKFNMAGIEVNMKTDIFGPDVWGAKSFARIDADFTGLIERDVRGFRVKRGYMEFTWEKTKLLMGQYYHPIAPDECYPDTLSNNFALLFDPFRYAPQMRVRHKFEAMEIMAVVMANNFRDIDTRRSVVPGFSLQALAPVRKHLVGFLINYHTRVPRLASDTNCKVWDSVRGIVAGAFLVLNHKNFKFKYRFVFGQDAQDYALLGGYAVKCRDPFTDEREYTTLRVFSTWAEFIYTWKSKELGLFVGYTKNLGAATEIIRNYINPDGEVESLVFGFVTDADYMFRIAPRFRWFVGPVIVGTEVEYTRASFGELDRYGKVPCGCAVSNTRFLASVYYTW